MNSSRGIARLRPLFALALVALTGALLSFNADSASARARKGIRQCYRQCQREGRAVERQCLKDGGSPLECEQLGESASGHCFLRCSGRG